MNIKKILLIIIGFFVVILLGSYIYFTRGLPSLSKFEDYRPNLVTTIYSDDGQVIGEFYIERRQVVAFSEVPQHLINAFLAAEDAQFYEHEGISYTGILRALYKNITAGRVVQGGSTITQQLAKSFLKTSERKLSRKVREAIIASRIERHLNKDEILGMYLNQIYFGGGAYGIQTAAEIYFGKDVSGLSIAESAMLAGLPKAPSKYSPYANYDLAKTRQEFVINRMLEEEYITREEAEKAISEEIRLRPENRRNLWVGPYFTEHARRYIESKYGQEALYKGGLKVYTTLDAELQRAANEAVDDGLRAHDKRRGYRGPIETLKSREAIDAFIQDIDRQLKGRPLEMGKLYKGLITKVNASTLTLSVSVGSHRGIIKKPDMSWARLYNPTNDPDGGKYEKFDRIFHEGDVIEVRVAGLPSDPLTPFRLKLEQEPLAEASLIAMEPSTGYVKAMVGGSDFDKTEFNRATQALRQPGSAFKPIIYAAALDKGYTPATIVIDSPLVFEEEENDMQWRPRNYDEQFMGPITVRQALSKSRNVVTIKILKDIGVASAIEYAEYLGITTPLARDLSLALGSSVTTLLEMTRAYATFENAGVRPEPLFITRVLDKDGTVLEENVPSSTPVLSPQTAYLMTNLLQSVIDEGTGWRARSLNRPAAGKTGTTNNLNDAWFLGYVPGLATGVWVGYDEEKKLGRYETGSRAALPIWVSFMDRATSGSPVMNFQTPEGMEYAKIDPKTGLLAGPNTKNPVFEVFKAGTVPTMVSEETEKPMATDFFMLDTGARQPQPEVKTMPDEAPMDTEAPPGLESVPPGEGDEEAPGDGMATTPEAESVMPGMTGAAPVQPTGPGAGAVPPAAEGLIFDENLIRELPVEEVAPGGGSTVKDGDTTTTGAPPEDPVLE